MMKVAIATTSPDKIDGIKNAICRIFQVEEFDLQITSKSINSGVSEQPFGDQTFLGALNRNKNIRKEFPDMDLYISCEAGIEYSFGQYFNVQVVCVDDRSGMYWGKSAGWPIPLEDIDIVKNTTLDVYLRGKGISCIEELLGPSNSRSAAVAQATEFALASRKLRNN